MLIMIIINMKSTNYIVSYQIALYYVRYGNVSWAAKLTFSLGRAMCIAETRLYHSDWIIPVFSHYDKQPTATAVKNNAYLNVRVWQDMG